VKARLPRQSAAKAEKEQTPQAKARQARIIVNYWSKILIWAIVIGAVFAYLWWQGQIRRLATYIQETREELKKCSWPSWEELKGSTAVVFFSIALLGVFTVAMDHILAFIFYKL
jgi:preprotein translocase subunit SecE